MKNIIQLIVLFSLLATMANAQTVLLEKDPAADTTKDDFGPNRGFYYHPYMAGGMPTGPRNNGARLATLGNYIITLGNRYKIKLGKVYSLGFDLSISNLTLTMRQEPGKILPDTVLHKTERLNWMFLSAGFFNRFSLGKHGNTLGNYLDIGIMGSYCPSFVHFYKDKPADGRTVKVRQRGLDYIERFNYNLYARLGFNRFAVVVAYRMSKLFKSSTPYPNIAPLAITFEIALM